MEKEEFRSRIRPVFYLSRALGLAPFSLGRPGLSPYAVIYTLLLLVPLVFGSVDMFRMVQAFDNLPKIGKMLLLLERINRISLAFLSWMLAVLRYRYLTEAVKGFLRVENQFKVLSIDVPHDAHFAYQIWQILLVLGLILVKSAFDFASNGFGNGVGMILTSLVNLVVLTQFVDFVLLFRSYFSLLNKELISFSDRNDGHHQTTANSDNAAPEEAIKGNFIARIDGNRTDPGSVLRRIREAHRYLFCIRKEFATFYSVQLLLTVSSSITTVISALYYFALYAISGLDLYRSRITVGIANTIFTAAYDFVKLLLIVNCCTSSSREVAETSVIVHGLLNRPTQTSHVKEELQVFSDQLMHENVVFTACGFFNLDFTLISTVIGAVSTYMIILIQFQITS